MTKNMLNNLEENILNIINDEKFTIEIYYYVSGYKIDGKSLLKLYIKNEFKKIKGEV